MRRILQNLRQIRSSNCWVIVLQSFSLFLPILISAENSRLLLTPSAIPSEQNLPLLMIGTGDQKPVCVFVKIGWRPSLEESSMFDIEDSSEARSIELMSAQLSISALIGALSWQQPWVNAHWKVSKISNPEGPATGAALAVGLLSAAGNAPYPKNVAVIASLYPDGTLGPVSQLLPRIETAANSGITRIVLSNLQRFEVTSGGKFQNVQFLAKAKGIDCFFVDHLSEAVEQVLNRAMPSFPEINYTYQYTEALFSYLDAQCNKELASLRPRVNAWPRKPELLAQFSSLERETWEKLFKDYDSAIDAYRAGLLYVTRDLLNHANAKFKAVSSWNTHQKNFDYKADYSRASTLRKKMIEHLSNPLIDQNELHSALVLSEENEWFDQINAQVEGAQILARQAFNTHSQANENQKTLAGMMLAVAIDSADYKLRDLEFHSGLYQAIQNKRPMAVANRAAFWLPHLAQSFLGAAEFLSQGLKMNSDTYRETLLFDPRLVTHARVLRDAHTSLENEIDRKIQAKQKYNAQEINVGFTPSAAYAPPRPPVPPPSPQRLSETAQVLCWVNDYCEVAALQEKYLGPNGVLEPGSLQWKNENRAALQRVLENAQLGARRGIALAVRAGVDPSILSLIYERACHLKGGGEDQNRLESLRQFWRCSLLGSLVWQLAVVTHPPLLIKPVEKSPLAPPIPPDTLTPSEENAEPPPASLPALPVSLDELDTPPEP